MTDCPNGEMRDLLPDLLHGTLAPAQVAAVEAHLAVCAECRAELALLGGVRESLRSSSAVDVGAIVSALPAYRVAAGGHRSGWRAAAAIAAIAIGGASLAVVTRDGGVAPVAGVAASSGRDTAERLSVAPPAPGGPQVAALGSAAATRRPAPAAPRELALEHGLGDLTDGELSALLDEIDSLDALPVVDMESAPLVPGNAMPSAGGAS